MKNWFPLRIERLSRLCYSSFAHRLRGDDKNEPPDGAERARKGQIKNVPECFQISL